LSVARAVAVLEVLLEGKVPPTRLSAAGYGEFHPIAPNDHDEGRARNRRVDLVVIPIGAAKAKEVLQ
jgi:chemotaxis protein MotB